GQYGSRQSDQLFHRGFARRARQRHQQSARWHRQRRADRQPGPADHRRLLHQVERLRDDLRRDRGRPVHAGVLRPSGRRPDPRSRQRRRARRRACRVRRHRDAGPRLDDPAPDRVTGDRAVHAADHVRRGARCLHAGAALLHRLARQLLCRLDRAQGHARHVGAGSAQRHAADGAAAFVCGA
ncbi:hypothetical protein KXV85_002935, partial [Aspergillus fumigatus]